MIELWAKGPGSPELGGCGTRQEGFLVEEVRFELGCEGWNRFAVKSHASQGHQLSCRALICWNSLGGSSGEKEGSHGTQMRLEVPIWETGSEVQFLFFFFISWSLIYISQMHNSQWVFFFMFLQLYWSVINCTHLKHTIWQFLVYAYICITITKIKIRSIPINRKSFLLALCNSSLPLPPARHPGNHWSDFHHYRLVCIF